MTRERIYIQLVTPDMAKSYLQKNTRNRHVRKGVVEKYANDMKNGMWESSANSTISFSESGELLDGQHRLLAVAQSETPQLFIIHEGMPEDAHIFDIGAPRSVSDVARLKDVQIGNFDVSVARMVLQAMTGASVKISSEMIIRYYTETQGMYVLMNRAIYTGSKIPLTRKAPVGMAIYCATRAGIDNGDMKEFCKIVNSGFCENDKDYAAIVLRNYLLSNEGKADLSGTFTARMKIESITEQAIRDYVDRKSRRSRYKAAESPYFKYVLKHDADLINEYMGTV